MGAIWQDVRFGFRMLLKNPGFTALAVLALALGIGANTAVFSVAIAFLTKPVSFPNLDRLVVVLNVTPGQTDTDAVSPADYLDWKRQSVSFEDMTTMENAGLNLTGNGDPERMRGELVPSNFFSVLGASPALGRPFLPEEEQPGRDQEAILSNGLWRRRFASDPGIIGKVVTFNGKTYTVVGVMGDDFNFPASAQVWLPLAMSDQKRSVRGDHSLAPIARLKSGVSLRQAQAEMFTIEGRLQRQFPQTDQGWSVKVMPVGVFVSGEISVAYCRMLIGAVIFVLLIACANVANLLFARSAGRQREMAVRRALGATRLRIVRQLLTESLLLAGAGACVGLLAGVWSIGVIRSYMPPEVERFLPMWKHVRLEKDVFLYTVFVAVMAGIISGLAPAFQTSKPEIYEELKEGGRSSTSGHARQRLRSIFVIAEVALSLILMVGAGLMAKGVRALLSANPNLEPEKDLTMRISLPESRYKTPQQQSAFYEQVLRRFETIPGVESAAIASVVPFGNGGESDVISIQGRPAQPSEYRVANIESVNPDYFRMMKIPLREGRLLAGSDSTEQPLVAVVDQNLARRYFPGENPIGKFIKLGAEDSKSPWVKIVGIVGDIKYEPYERLDTPALYRPYQQYPQNLAYLAIRTKSDPTSFGAAARSQIAGVDPEQPVFDVTPLQAVISNRVIGVSYVAVILGVMGILALVLASIGVYGVMAYSVTERTHEIGVRLTLGAQQRDILRLVLTRGILLTGIGLLIGLPSSIALAQLMANLLYGVSAADVITFSGTTFLLCGITLLACYIPARHAMRVDPMVALRYE
ncbi:MAG: ABC transporter permease [Candidatus Acidiferrales bacterium]